jgi:hypothetical protein
MTSSTLDGMRMSERGDMQGCQEDELGVCQGGPEKARCRREILFSMEDLEALLVNKVLGIIGKNQCMTPLNTPGDVFGMPVGFLITRGEHVDECRVGTPFGWMERVTMSL